MSDVLSTMPVSTPYAVAGLSGIAGPTVQGALPARSVNGAAIKTVGGVALRIGSEGAQVDGTPRIDDVRDAEAGRSDAVREDHRPRDREAAEVMENLRTRLDPETLRLFTEVIDPVTREALYRVPPTAISEAAEREGEFLARYERMVSAMSLAPLPRTPAVVSA